MAVVTTVAKQKDFEVVLESIGTVSALSTVDVKPQINSVVTQVHIRRDSSSRQAMSFSRWTHAMTKPIWQRPRHSWPRTPALLADAQRQLARSKDLVSRQSHFPKNAVDTNQAQVDSQQANLLADRAAVDAA